MSSLVLVVFSLISLARAEYRAFELAIEDQNKGSTRKVVSVLDHLQYAEYYVVGANEKVHLANTWRCSGNTSNFKAICPPPDAANSAAK